MEWLCEVEYASLLSEYYEYGSKILSESGTRCPLSKLICCTRHTGSNNLELIGYFSIDSTFLNKLPVVLRRLLPEDFQDRFVPNAFSDSETYFNDLCDREFIDETAVTKELKWFLDKTKNVDDTDQPRVSLSINVYSSDNFDEEIKDFTLDSRIQTKIKKFCLNWNSVHAMKSDRLPSPLSICTRYADSQPPLEFSQVKDWKAFGLKNPSKRLVVVSEALCFEDSGPKQFLLFSPKRLAESIVFNFQREHPRTFCEIFRAGYDVTCIPFDLDITGINATRILGDKEKVNVFVKRCVDELRLRLNDQLRHYVNDKFDVTKWPVGIFQGHSSKANKISLHVYQRLPWNVSISGIDHVKILVTRMVQEIKKSRHTSSQNGTLLGHWEYVSGNQIYESQMEDNHATFREINNKLLLNYDESDVRFVSYIDTKIYKVNGSLRLPGCSKSKANRNILVKCSGEDIHESDIKDSLVHYPHSSISFGTEIINIVCFDENRNGNLSRHVFVKDEDVQRISCFIEDNLKTVVTKCKQTPTGVFFDTQQTWCPLAKKDHRGAKQFYAYSSTTRTLVRKCWHSNCQGKATPIYDHCLTTS